MIAGQSIAGAGGPASDYIGYGNTVAALSGLASTVGYDGEEPIGTFQGLWSDVISALATVLASLTGLYARAHTRGVTIDVSQWEATMALAGDNIVQASITGSANKSAGLHHPLLHPHGMYPCRADPDDDPQSAWMSIAVGSDEEWRSLVALLGSLPAGAEK